MVKEDTSLEIDHLRMISNTLNEKRKIKVLTDVSIECNGQSYFAHKSILSVSSNFFSGIFEESDCQNVLELPIESDIFEILLHFIYTGILKIPDDASIKRILGSANYLGLDLVIQRCTQLMLEKMDLNSIVDIMFENSETSELYQCAATHLAENIQEFSKLPAFAQLSEDFVISIFTNSKLNCNEEEKFETILTWIRHNTENRLKNNSSLLVSLDLSQVSMPFLNNLMDDHLILENNFLMQKVFKEIKRRFQPTLTEKSSDHHPLIQNEEPHLRQTSSLSRISKESDVLPSSCKANKLQASSNRTSSVKHQSPSTCTKASREDSKTVNIEDIIGDVMVALLTEKEKTFSICKIVGEGITIKEPVEFPFREEGINFPLDASVCVIKDEIYILGGRTKECCRALKTTLAYNIRKKNWTRKSDMNVPSYFAGCCSFDGRIYVAGGLDQTNMRQSALQCFIVDSNEWKRYCPMPLTWEKPAASAANGCLYLFGGYAVSTQHHQNRMYKNETKATGLKYDIDRDQWTKITTTLPVGHLVDDKEYCIATIKGKIYAIKKIVPVQENTLRSFFEYCPKQDIWEDKSMMIDLKSSILFIGEYKNSVCIVDEAGKIIVYSTDKRRILYSDKIKFSHFCTSAYISSIKL